jgi:hypothetical protein
MIMSQNNHEKKHVTPTFSARAGNKYRCNQNKKDMVTKTQLEGYKSIFWAEGPKAASSWLRNNKTRQL